MEVRERVADALIKTIAVLDASVALAAVLPEPNSLVAQVILARIVDEGAVVPMTPLRSSEAIGNIVA